MLDLVLFAVLAGFICFRLYKVLGNKDYENPDHINKYRPRPKADKDSEPKAATGDSNVVNIDKSQYKHVTSYAEVEKKYGAEIAESVKSIHKYEPLFDIEEFLAGAESAFDMIICAFAKGDLPTLKNLTSSQVFSGLKAAVDEYPKDKVNEVSVIAVESAITNIELNRKKAVIGVRFDSQQVVLVKDDKGNVIEGDPSDIENVSDIWLFERQLGSNNPSWILVETRKP